MILQKKQPVRVYQVAMELLTKTTESPFIAILILTKELGAINEEDVRTKLFPNLPLRACYNLSNRLKQQDYFVKYEESYFELTQKGVDSAADKSMWVGEKGIYNVYMTSSPFLQQKIIGIEPVKNNAEDDRKQKPKSVPNELSNYENDLLTLKNKDYRIEKIDDKCFKLNDEDWTLALSAQPKQKAILSIKGNNSIGFQQEMPFEFDVLQNIVLQYAFENAFEGGLILEKFNSNNTSFVRNYDIEKPMIRYEDEAIVFEKTALNNIKCRPATREDAQLWYTHLLKNNIKNYFLLESAFDSHSLAHAEMFKPHFNLTALKRNMLINELSKYKTYFYQRAKLETINFLNF